MDLHSMAASLAKAEGLAAPFPIAARRIDLGMVASRLNEQAAIAGARGFSVLPGVLRGYADIASALAADPEPLS